MVRKNKRSRTSVIIVILTLVILINMVGICHSQDPVQVEAIFIRVELNELYEVSNPMNKIPNDYEFPEDVIQNQDAIAAYFKKHGEVARRNVKIERPHLILVASDGTNPLSFKAKWDYEPISTIELAKNATGTCNMNAYPPFDLELVPVDEQGNVSFTVAAYAEYFRDCVFFIHELFSFIEAGAIGKVVIVNEILWEDAADTLRIGVLIGGESWFSMHWFSAATLLSYFIGRPDLVSDHEGYHYEYDEISSQTLVKGDIWYEWLTHKVGVVWNGEQANVPLYRWFPTSGISERIRQTEEMNQVYEQKLLAEFDTLKSLAEGDSLEISFNVNSDEIEFPEDGSNYDLFVAIARARLEGHLIVAVGSSHPESDKVNIQSIFIDVTVKDLYDFNFFNPPLTSGNAATLQAGWELFSNQTGGPGQVFFTEFLVHDEKTNPFVLTQP